MDNSNTAVAPAQAQAVAASGTRAPVYVGMRGLELKSLDDVWRVSGYISKSGLAPKGLDTPEAVFVAIAAGLELGLPVMSAIQNTAVINGRPGVFGDIPLALVRSSGLLEEFSEQEIGTANTDSWGYKCVAKRVGGQFAHSIFTVADAKKAGLWGTNVWAKYPRRMLMFRARGYLLRDQFGDVLKGVKTVEELQELEGEDRFRKAKNVHPLPQHQDEPTPGAGPVAIAQEDPGAPAAGSEPKSTAQRTPAPSSAGTARKGPTLVEESLSAEEKAEAGLAPGQPQQESKPKPPAAPELSANQKALADLLTASGFTFEEFIKAGPEMVAAGNKMSGILAWDTFAGYEDIPEKGAQFFLKAKDGMLEQLRAGRQQ